MVGPAGAGGVGCYRRTMSRPDIVNQLSNGWTEEISLK
jgi:hypothetical protein